MKLSPFCLGVMHDIHGYKLVWGPIMHAIISKTKHLYLLSIFIISLIDQVFTKIRDTQKVEHQLHHIYQK